MSAAWETATVGACLVPVSTVGKSKIQTKDYKSAGSHPIVDQGRPRVAGWTDSLDAVIDNPLPLIVFGDHSRTFKYIDEPFARGADGTQLLRPVDEIAPLFFFYACRAIDLPSRGYNRHFTLLREKEISFPKDLVAQQSIALLLRRAERAVTLQDELVELLEETKSASMRQLFTRGLRGEAQKETEIGPVPNSWDVITINDVALKTQYGLSVRGQAQGQFPILRMNCQDNGRVQFRDLQYVDLDEETLTAFRLEDGDLLFNRTNSIEHVGRTAVFEGAKEAVFASYLVRLKVDTLRCLPQFLNYYMNRREVQQDIKRLASRAVGQANINATKLRTIAFPLPPSLNEQAEIIAILDALDRKIDLHRRKRDVLEQLFKSLLHKLMTGEVPVDDLDLRALPSIDGSAA